MIEAGGILSQHHVELLLRFYYYKAI